MRPSLLSRVRHDSAKVVASVLKGDARRQASSSIKSLVYASNIASKQATLALTCRTLKYLPVLRKILEATDLARLKPRKLQIELLYVLLYEFLFGEEVAPSGDAERLLLSRKSAVRAALARLLVHHKVSKAEDLLPSDSSGDVATFPRYVRVNTLKRSTEEVVKVLEQHFPSKVEHDNLIADLLVLPPATDLHRHPLVQDGSVLLQGKSSCMPAQALLDGLEIHQGLHVLDACAAPGNKTAHLAALMKGQGKIIACELNSDRLQRLLDTIALVGACNVEVLHQDFLETDVNSSPFSQVTGILLDPSCSGSGTAARRLDHLLPSSASAAAPASNESEQRRVEKLARFQEAALRHALSFPRVEKIVYSTCSVNQRENEDVIRSLLPLANSLGFRLGIPFPTWPHRGLPVLPAANHVLRTDGKRDHTDGFFLALFIRVTPTLSLRGKGLPQSVQDSQERHATTPFSRKGKNCKKKATKFVAPIKNSWVPGT